MEEVTVIQFSGEYTEFELSWFLKTSKAGTTIYIKIENEKNVKYLTKRKSERKIKTYK